MAGSRGCVRLRSRLCAENQSPPTLPGLLSLELDAIGTIGIVRARVGDQQEIVGNHGVEVGSFQDLDFREPRREEVHDGASASLRAVGVDGLERAGATLRGKGESENAIGHWRAEAGHRAERADSPAQARHIAVRTTHAREASGTATPLRISHDS